MRSFLQTIEVPDRENQKCTINVNHIVSITEDMNKRAIIQCTCGKIYSALAYDKVLELIKIVY